MWTFTSKDNKNKIAIPYSNIDYVRLSKGVIPTDFSGNATGNRYYHELIDRYFDTEYLTIIYKKSGFYIPIEGEVAFNQLCIDSKI